MFYDETRSVVSATEREARGSLCFDFGEVVPFYDLG